MSSLFEKELIRNALDFTVNEMFWLTVRSAKSTIFTETADLSTSIADSKGNLVTMSVGIPIWLAIPTFVAKAMAIERKKSLSPGDVLVSNDPYLTGSHVSDIGFVMPVFCKDELIAVSMTKGHVSDVGGLAAGSIPPGATEIYQEGLVIPPVYYKKEGKLNKDVLDMILANTRVPDALEGDLAALVAGVERGNRRILELIERYGVDSLKTVMNDIIEDGFKQAKAGLNRLPKGEFHAVDYLDDAYPSSEEPVKLSVRVEITEEEFIADFSEMPESIRFPMNMPYPSTMTAVAFAYIAAIDPHIPVNQGVFRPLRIIVPPNSVLNAKRPFGTSVYWELSSYIVNLIWKALAPAIPDRLSAGHAVSVSGALFYFFDRRTGKEMVLVDPCNPGGWGAHSDHDGESALVSVPDGETYVMQAETVQLKFPIFMERYELNCEDGVGHGKFRGGFGVIKEYRVLGDSLVTSPLNRSKIPTWGINGGKDGTANTMEIIRNGEMIKKGGKILNFPLKKGDIVRIKTAGGGGWGKPMKRNPELVLKDVRDRLISIEQAREIYKVIIKPENLTIDLHATNKLRKGGT